MRTTQLTLLACGAAALALSACNNQENPGQSDPVNAVQDATSEAVGSVSAMTAGQTVEGYVMNAAMGDMYEIQAADMALERTENAQVRELAQMIKNDHQAASQRLQSAAQAAGETVPTELDERRQGMLDNLRAASSAEEFDRVYIAQQVAAHEEALALHRGFADSEEHPQLAQHAQMVIEPIEMHHRRAEQLQEGMGQDGGNEG
ncbi:DUF4142 domain-containing protein [Brevundimonas sp.]|uniref:DUF4142 domain-containing protein n=1 Tax=Brevundimonas sp. TaxID=1871086 RepID=UPI0025E1A570|nr:DUF4142 domain-containing protein [Brevundimonas sp.]